MPWQKKSKPKAECVVRHKQRECGFVHRWLDVPHSVSIL